MSEQDQPQSTGTGSRRARLRERIGARPWVRSAALVGSGLVAGGILAGAVTASATDDRRGAAEPALTGDTAEQVEEAVLAEYPDAEIQRVETDADGVYEAHVVTEDGERLTVELDDEFAITGTEAGREGRGGHGGHGGDGG